MSPAMVSTFYMLGKRGYTDYSLLEKTVAV